MCTCVLLCVMLYIVACLCMYGYVYVLYVCMVAYDCVCLCVFVGLCMFVCLCMIVCVRVWLFVCV